MNEFNPIVNESPLPLLEFGGAGAHSSGRTVLVFLSDDTAEAQVGRPPAVRKRLTRHFWRYEVDTAHHTTWVSLKLPAVEEAFFFTARICFTWTVVDAVAVARHGIKNAKPIIWRHLDRVLRDVSRHHSIEESAVAEREMNLRLEKEPSRIEYGIEISGFAVNLELDERTRDYLAGRVESLRSRNVAGDEHALNVLQQRHAREVAEIRGAFEVAVAQHKRDMEAARSKHELALKAQRVDFYRRSLAGDSYDFLVLQLIEHPEDITAVMEMLHAGKQKYYDRSREVIKDLLDRELVNAADVDPLREHAIEQLRSALDIAAPQSAVLVERGRTRTVVAATTTTSTPDGPSTTTAVMAEEKENENRRISET